jgi:pyruvate/2-oxoglutarate dehydrogenase complex dihydrolipoamide dehydrogenase (E3) component
VKIKLKFDYIILAFGAGYSSPIRYTRLKDDTLVQRKSLIKGFNKELKDNPNTNVLIVGGGYTSIELACAIKHKTQKEVTLITRSKTFCKAFNTKAQTLITKYMKETMKINVMTETTIDKLDQS